MALSGTVDGSEIRNNHRLDVLDLVNHGINYQSQVLVFWLDFSSTINGMSGGFFSQFFFSIG